MVSVNAYSDKTDNYYHYYHYYYYSLPCTDMYTYS